MLKEGEQHRACQKLSVLLSCSFLRSEPCSADVAPLPDVLVSFDLSMRFADVLNVLDSELARKIASSSSVITLSCMQK